MAHQLLLGRRYECEALDRLLAAVRAGESRALVIRGEAGVGKTALLEYARESASGCRLVWASGVESEMELAFAGLHQLCAPILDRLERLPGPQCDTLATAFGLRDGAPPDRFLVGLAVLSLLAEGAAERPLVCFVDDAQWLDRASAQALTFAARRVGAEAVALVFAVRAEREVPELAGLPEMTVEGLRHNDARALLKSVMAGPLDERIRDRIVAEAGGNPLALLELPRTATHADLAGGFALPGAVPVAHRIEDSFQRRLADLPDETQQLMLVAAAEPLGEPLLVWRAAELLGLRADAAGPATSAGLLEFGARVRFRHPLVRSAVYTSSSPQARRSAHRALAEIVDPDLDPDRRAWHRAHASAGADEDVAAELERSAGRAQARGGLAAAAAFLEHATDLTPEPRPRARRALAAARGKYLAGAPEEALRLVGLARAGPLDQLDRAQADLLQGEVTFSMGRGDDAPPLLLDAARQLEPLDVALARETYLEAFGAAMYAGRLGGGVRAVAEAARAAPSPGSPRAVDILLDGLALVVTDGYAAGAPALRRALVAFSDPGLPKEEGLRWLGFACHAAIVMWDYDAWHLLAARQVEVVRETGALTLLPLALSSLAGTQINGGELPAASAVVDEIALVAEAIGTPAPPYAAVSLGAWQGRDDEASARLEAALGEVSGRGEGMGITFVRWLTAVLCNARGRYEEALVAAEDASRHADELWSPLWQHELVEAAARAGRRERADEALESLAQMTQASGTDWALGVEARSRALLSEGSVAERLYRDALDLLARTRVRVALARGHLLYGEWLRSEGRRADAREQLRTAHKMLTAMGADAFARRAERELAAAGDRVRPSVVRAGGQLTAQEAQIARLARDGLTNPEIGARLFVSRRTVEYHLRKVFIKLGISSRADFGRVPAEALG